MRILSICSLLLLSGYNHIANDSWDGQNEAQYFITSAVPSTAGNEYSQHQGMSRDRSAMLGLMFSASLGASEEPRDSHPEGNGWSRKDFAWDIVGANTSCIVRQLTRR